MEFGIEPVERLVWALLLCGALVVIGMQRARLHELMTRLKDKTKTIDTLSYAKEEDESVHVIEAADLPPTRYDDVMDDWMRDNPGVKPEAERNR